MAMTKTGIRAQRRHATSLRPTAAASPGEPSELPPLVAAPTLSNKTDFMPGREAKREEARAAGLAEALASAPCQGFPSSQTNPGRKEAGGGAFCQSSHTDLRTRASHHEPVPNSHKQKSLQPVPAKLWALNQRPLPTSLAGPAEKLWLPAAHTPPIRMVQLPECVHAEGRCGSPAERVYTHRAARLEQTYHILYYINTHAGLCKYHALRLSILHKYTAPDPSPSPSPVAGGGPWQSRGHTAGTLGSGGRRGPGLL